jgi:hypothetical protein
MCHRLWAGKRVLFVYVRCRVDGSSRKGLSQREQSIAKSVLVLISFLPSVPPPSSPFYEPGIEWFGQKKLVIFEDAEEYSIEITSVFSLGYRWTKQIIITELDQVIFQQHAYHW